MKKVIVMLMLGIFLCNPISAKAEEYYLPTEIETLCEYYGSEYGIAPELLESIIWTESRGQKFAKNTTCIGICQINTESQLERLNNSAQITGISDYYDYTVQIRSMCSLLNELSYGDYAEEQQDISLTIAQYHGESKAVSKYESGYISDYVESVLELSYELETLHGKH